MKRLPRQFSNPIQILLFLGAVLLLLPAPWIQNSIPFLFMEIIGFVLTAIVLLFHPGELPIPSLAIFFIFYSIVVLSLSLIPLPIDTWLQLPGHSLYQSTIQLMEKTGHTLSTHSISLDAYSSTQMLLAILPSLGIFLATSSLEGQKIHLLAKLFIIMAAYQATWGMIQYSSSGVSAHGSYINRDHYVTLMECALPINISLITNHIAHNREYDRSKYKITLSFYLFSLVLIFLAGMFSMSRGGIPNIFLGIILTPLLATNHIKKTYLVFAITLFLILTLSLVYQTGAIPIINRFIGEDPQQDARWIMFAQQLEAIRAFFPLGSGPGTFADAYTAFQPLERVGATFVSHAHNDYLELLVETGLIGVSIIVLFIVIYFFGWLRLWQQQHSLSSVTHLQAAAGVGILCSLLHAFFDFNFHTIPYPIIFSFLIGIFLTTKKSV